jgi:hypothetical protein
MHVNAAGWKSVGVAGIVSARGRDIGEGPCDEFIQIDAPVNEGNSGGPTFNVGGEVIGVNTAIYSPSGRSIGVAFDIPAETVKLVIQQPKDKGHVTRGWIGVEMQSVTPTIAEVLGLTKDRGALIAKVDPDGPAGKQRIEVGDVITSVNGYEVKLARTIAGIAPGTDRAGGEANELLGDDAKQQAGQLAATPPAHDNHLVEVLAAISSRDWVISPPADSGFDPRRTQLASARFSGFRYDRGYHRRRPTNGGYRAKSLQWLPKSLHASSPFRRSPSTVAMTPNPITIGDDTWLEQIVRLMESRNVKHFLVMRSEAIAAG